MDDAIGRLINGAIYGGAGMFLVMVGWIGYSYWLKHYGWK